MSKDYEKLGVFYLGRRHDPESGDSTSEPLLYDSKDLTTHAVVVGMTGSGKTGLCLSLLEEAAMDRIPAIAIDPKGDIGNLLLTFPELAPADFRPWIDESQAMRKGQTPDEFAASTAEKWRDGLAAWDQAPERIRQLRDNVDLAIYTPGSSAGRPLTVLQSFAAPSEAVRQDSDMMRDRIASAASGLLALLGIQADPVNSREHILLANLFRHSWSEGQSLTLADLFRLIQTPPFERVGIVDLESFYPSADRTKLAMRLNNLLASPSFAGWLEGEPLDISQLLTTNQGKPRISVLSIAHLSDVERMFFVTILLNEVLSWMRSQPGTSSLRAILYMDEVFGFFPPTANPPSKLPMLTLLKQARAFGLGCVLATQNPVDLDYKGLSNTGTWFLGRLQTERDKLRVIEGLEGAAAQSGGGFDRQAMERILSGLKSRVFLLNNVHDNEPVIFETRWAMSYLRGPLTRDQIKALTATDKPTETPSADKPASKQEEKQTQQASKPRSGGMDWSALKPVVPRSAKPTTQLENASSNQPPVLPPSIPQCYLQAVRPSKPGHRLVYRPALLGVCHAHYVRVGYGVDDWKEVALILGPMWLGKKIQWDKAIQLDAQALRADPEPQMEAEFGELPAALANEKSFSRLHKALRDTVYRQCPIRLWFYEPLKLYSGIDEREGEFRSRIGLLLNEERELEIEKLKKKYGDQFEKLEARVRRAEDKLATEQEQLHGERMDSMMSMGDSLLGALMGRKTSRRRRTSSTRSGVGKEKIDVARAERELDELRRQLQTLDRNFKKELSKHDARPDLSKLKLETVTLAPRKGDLQVKTLTVAWEPVSVDAQGHENSLALGNNAEGA